MAGKLHIIVGAHFHVPYGAGDEEFEKVYTLRLRPFISTLFKFPKIQGTLHCSGTLLNWLERVYPEFLVFIEDLVSAKQVEILGGGFYEPLFSVIPQQDRIGQVELLTTYLRKRFGKKPQGCWIPAMDWEQNLVASLASCGIAYTFLSESQFALAGLSGRDLYAPCISEDQGKLIAVFPVQGQTGDPLWGNRPRAALEKMAAALPAGRDWLVSVFPGPGRLLPDNPDQLSGELKNPGEAELFWQEFFEGLYSCESFLEFTSPGRYLKGRRDLVRACFPSSMEGGGNGKNGGRLFLRQYLLDYPEANGIYSKMIFSHTLANQLRGDKSRKRTALEELWKAQGIDVFYPAENGGIYRPAIRRSAYKALLEAEKITREAGDFIPSLMNFDFDFDNETEYLFRGDRINCYVRLLGAGVFELDYLPNSWNYLDTFDQPEPGPRGRRNRKAAFTDRILPADFSPADILSGRNDGIRDCGEERFDLREMDKARGKASFYLPPAAETPGGGPFRALGVEKSYRLHRDTLTVNYTLSNTGREEAGFLFASSIDLSFPGEGENFVRVLKGAGVLKPETGEGALGGNVLAARDTDLLKFQDLKNEAIISLGADRPFSAWIFSRRTAPETWGGPGLYQSSCVMPFFPAAVKPGESWKLAFTLKFTH
ncbi:MAG: DUF1925 domain-containing protein [Treponema sp.]|jgi:hypothetical protein|nr:DUF1925 domain-containing protein [Treponema sp.]